MSAHFFVDLLKERSEEQMMHREISEPRKTAAEENPEIPFLIKLNMV